MASADAARVQSERTLLFDCLTGQTLSNRASQPSRMPDCLAFLSDLCAVEWNARLINAIVSFEAVREGHMKHGQVMFFSALDTREGGKRERERSNPGR